MAPRLEEQNGDMGELHVFMNITLDGVIQANGGPNEQDGDFAYPGWERPYGDAESGAQLPTGTGPHVLVCRRHLASGYAAGGQPRRRTSPSHAWPCAAPYHPGDHP